MTAAVLIAGLVTAGAGVLGYSATRAENPAAAVTPEQAASPPATAAPVAQDPPRPAATKPAANPGPLVVQVEVVDPEGHRLSGAEVVATISYTRGTENADSVLERARSDGQGQVRLEVARERPGAKVQGAFVWAYQPGHAMATTSFSLMNGTSPPTIRLTLDQPVKWTITVVGPDDRPIAGLRLAPRKLRSSVRRPTMSVLTIVPDELLEPLTVTTDAQGVATLSYLSRNMVPLSIEVTGPGVAPHTLPLDTPTGRRSILKLGGSGRVVGIVRTASGEPLADVPVEVWVQGAGICRPVSASLA